MAVCVKGSWVPPLSVSRFSVHSNELFLLCCVFLFLLITFCAFFSLFLLHCSLAAASGFSTLPFLRHLFAPAFELNRFVWP